MSKDTAKIQLILKVPPLPLFWLVSFTVSTTSEIFWSVKLLVFREQTSSLTLKKGSSRRNCYT